MSGQPSTSGFSSIEIHNEWKLSKSISKRRKRSKTNFGCLPEDVLLAVFQNCRNSKDVLSVRSVNRRLGSIIERNGHLLQRPKANGIIISVNQRRIPFSQIGKLRIKEDDSKFFQVSLFKNNRNGPLNFTEPASSSSSSSLLSKVLKRFIVSEEVVFKSISITNTLVANFLKPVTDVRKVSKISLISCTFEKDLDPVMFSKLLQKTSCKELSVEYCFGAEDFVVDSLFENVQELKKFVLMSVPGQKFLRLTDGVLKNLSKLEVVYMPNCFADFTVSGINEFLKLQKSRDSESSRTNIDLGQIQSHPLDVKKFASINLYSLRAKPSGDKESVLFFSSCPSLESTFFPQNSPYGETKAFRSQKFQVEFKLNPDAKLSLLTSPESPQCMDPFFFIAQVLGGFVKPSFPTDQIQFISS
ncbi:hypothetical protein FO519_000121 [Halicephalobus sp. NKZ332]|nr:hypothetical protein FO519_000121 [Halicephalobus sp. NKZ332]